MFTRERTKPSEIEQRLSECRYLLGHALTLADIRLFGTLVRFDPVYHYHFKCNLRRLVDYPNLWAYARDFFQTPGIGETIDFDHIKRHYYQTHPHINPTGIVPKGAGPRLARAARALVTEVRSHAGEQIRES